MIGIRTEDWLVQFSTWEIFVVYNGMEDWSQKPDNSNRVVSVESKDIIGVQETNQGGTSVN